jgi:beta-galactosidase
MESFKAISHKAYNGLCLAIIQAGSKAGPIRVTIHSPGLPSGSVLLQSH